MHGHGPAAPAWTVWGHAPRLGCSRAACRSSVFPSRERRHSDELGKRGFSDKHAAVTVSSSQTLRRRQPRLRATGRGQRCLPGEFTLVRERR